MTVCNLASAKYECKSATKVANVKIIPVINNKKHGMFSCGVITGV
jgi:hypothetical protein